MARRITAEDGTIMAGLDRMECAGITIWAHHGVFDHERRDGQEFLIDLVWWQDMGTAAETDNVNNAIDYGQVSSLAAEVAGNEPADLIETVARRVLSALLDRFPMDYAQVRIHKPHAPLDVQFGDVILTMTAARDDKEREVVFSLGSNIGAREAYLQFAATALASTSELGQPRVSGVVETVAQGEIRQPDFLNAVLIARTRLSAPALLRRALQIEALAHRTREIAHGPRTLDIDLIAVDGEVWDTPELTLPHPRAAQRRFVLLPWLELNPAAQLGGVPVVTLAEQVSAQQVQPYPVELFLP